MMEATIKETEVTTGLPSAKTNVWCVPMSDEELIKKLLLLGAGPINVDYLCREIPESRGESKEKYNARVHGEGRRMIRRHLALSPDAVISYEFLQMKRMCFFFFLSAKRGREEDVFSALVAAEIPLPRLAQALIGLRVKLDLLTQLGKDYAIETVHHNGALYIGTDVYPSKKEGRALIDTFEARFYYSQNRELVSTLHNRTFLAAKAAVLQAPLVDTVMTIRTSRESYLSTEQVDARQYGRKKFMRFQSGYASSQNYAHTLVARCVDRLFKQIDVDAVQETFCATSVWSDFVTAESQLASAKTVIVDNYGPYPSDEVKSAVYAQLLESLGECDIVPAAGVGTYETLSESKNYLFINKKQGGRHGSSIINAATGTRYNTFWQAYKVSLANDNCQFDLYTRLKIAHFSKKRRVVMQGIDLPELLNATDETPVSTHVLLKVRKELWLKECVLRQQAISGLSSMEDGAYTFIYIRRPEDMFFASALSSRFTGGLLSLQDQRTFDSESELLFAFPMLKRLARLYDASFYLLDRTSGALLTAYTSAAVPQILGNVNFDNVQRFQEQGDCLRKLTAPDDNPLPYYVNPRQNQQYHHIFLQEAPPNLRYFVSPKGNPQSVFATQCRTYNILVWNSLGALVRPFDEPVTQMFLRSFTDDIVLNGQVSKSSLLLKAAKLYLEN